MNSGSEDVLAKNAKQAGWSTSYHAGSSSSDSSCTSDEETEDECAQRGRNQRECGDASAPGRRGSPSSFIKVKSSGDTSSDQSSAHSLRVNRATTFTRSRSPALNQSQSTNGARHTSPAIMRQSRKNPLLMEMALLPAQVCFRVPLVLKRRSWAFEVETRKLAEFMLLFVSLLQASSRLAALTADANQHCHVYELRILAILSLLYFIWTHSKLNSAQESSTAEKDPSALLHTTTPAYPQRPASPRTFDGKDSRKAPAPSGTSKSDFGYIWMSVPKNYRESTDDGIATGLLLGPLVSASLLISSINTLKSSAPPLGNDWLIEPPRVLHDTISASEALVLSRHGLVNLSTYCATIILVHVCSSWWMEASHAKAANKPEGERASVPRSEGRRFVYYALFTVATSLGMVCLKAAFQHYDVGIWKDLRIFEAAITAPFYTLTLYAGLRLAHRGFTVGELALTCFGGTAVCLEFLNLTIAGIWPVTTPFIRTYRLPTPLLTFQIAMVVGSLLTGFMLSPFLVLSRNNAQRPTRRIRSPDQQLRNRKYYALGFYVGSILIIGGVIGLWTRWMLGNRDPWLWAIFYLLEGEQKWSRGALLAYWALLGCISVVAWGRQLSRSRKYRLRQQEPSKSVQAYDIASPIAGFMGNSAADLSSGSAGDFRPPSPGLGKTFPTLSQISMHSFPHPSNVSTVANEILDAADKRVPTLSLNARRKYFHGLAVIMFVPGIALDPAFTHLAFGAAFALFTFTEYVRYFAVYPFGATIHLFLNEFLDHRDSGTAILSHFYLLTGCAGSLWLEDRSKLLQLTGLLSLGVGDAAASIAGRRLGLRRWSPATSKTVEGSLAFVASVFVSAWALRLCGLIAPFSSVRYLLAVILSALLEAVSDQNDNLTLPLYAWSMQLVMGL